MYLDQKSDDVSILKLSINYTYERKWIRELAIITLFSSFILTSAGTQPRRTYSGFILYQGNRELLWVFLIHRKLLSGSIICLETTPIISYSCILLSTQGISYTQKLLSVYPINNNFSWYVHCPITGNYSGSIL